MSTARQAQDLLDQIAVAAGKKVETLILDMRDQINEAITACVEDAQDAAEKTEAGKHAVLTLPVSIKWDLDTRAVQVSLAVAIKRKATEDIMLDDPAQPNLPLTVVDEDDAEETESDKAALASIIQNAEHNATSATAAKAVRKLAKAIRNAGAIVTVATNTEDIR